MLCFATPCYAMLCLYGLLEAKNFVEALPKAVKEDIDKDEANKIKEALEAEGGEITIK